MSGLNDWAGHCMSHADAIVFVVSLPRRVNVSQPVIRPSVDARVL